MRIDWTHEAELALDLLAERLREWSEEAAEAMVRRVNHRVLALRDYPRIGRVVPEYGVERFRELIVPPHRIMYQVFADRVEIVTIRHSAELLPRMQ